MKKPLTLSYGNIVIGSSLEAFLFAYHARLKVIWTRSLQPLLIDEFKTDFGLGINKWKAWNKYMSALGLSGYLPFEDKITSINIVDSNMLRVATFDKGWYFIKFHNLIIFDDHELYGLEPHTGITDNRVELIDHMRVQGYNLSDLKSEPKLKKYIDKVYTFEVRKQKEMLVFSTIEEDKIDTRPEYLIKIHMEQSLEDRKKTKSSIPTVFHLKRTVRQLGRNIYQDTPTINFIYKDVEELYKLVLTSYEPNYMHYLNSKLNLKCEKTYRDILLALSQLPRHP